MAYYTSYKDNQGIIYCDQSPVNCVGSTIDISHRTICNTFNMVSSCGLIGPNAGSMLLLDPNNGWNCNLCANDLPYNTPVSVNDDLYFQFQEIDNINGQNPNQVGICGWGNGLCDVYAKDCCTNAYLEEPGNPGFPMPLWAYSSDYFVGVFNVPDYKGNPFYKNIQGIKIPLDVLYTDFKAQFPNSDCFYLEFIFNRGTLATPINISYYTNPYQFTNNCLSTLVLQSTFTSTDCNGHYYGNQIIDFSGQTVGTVFPHNNYIRIPAIVERTGFSISKEYVGVYPKVTSSQLQYNYQMNSYRIPEQVAVYISNLLTGQYVYANGIEFLIDGEINKNNETGSQWFIEANMRQIDCSKTFSCDGAGGGGVIINPGGTSVTSMTIDTCTSCCPPSGPASFTCMGATTVTVYYDSNTQPTFQNINAGACVLYYDINLTQKVTGFVQIFFGTVIAGPTPVYEFFELFAGNNTPQYIGSSVDQCI